MSRRTANKKLAKLYRPSRKRPPERLIVARRTKKVEGYDQKKIRRRAPPLSNSFRRHLSNTRYWHLYRSICRRDCICWQATGSGPVGQHCAAVDLHPGDGSSFECGGWKLRACGNHQLWRIVVLFSHDFRQYAGQHHRLHHGHCSHLSMYSRYQQQQQQHQL